jgi:hypothetical protein
VPQGKWLRANKSDSNRTANGLEMGWSARDLDQGQVLARQLSRSTAPGDELARNPSVEIAIDPRGGQADSFVVKLRDANRWLEIGPDTGGNGSAVSSGPNIRLADSDPHARTLMVTVLDNDRVAAQLNDVAFLVATPQDRQPVTLWRVAEGRRTPPTGSSTLDVTLGNGTRVSGVLDPATGEVYAAAATVRQALEASDLGAFGTRLDSGDLNALANEITSDSLLFRARVQALFDKAVKDAGRLLKSGDDAQAVRFLDAQVRQFGPQPELTLRKAAAEIGATGNPDRAVAAQRLGGVRRPGGPRDTLLDELRFRVEQPTLDAERAERLGADHGSGRVEQRGHERG